MYDVGGLRADADVMVVCGTRRTPTTLQDGYHAASVCTAFGARLDPVWSQMALHRPAEFNKSHSLRSLADEEPRAYMCVYPFVRSYEWYLLDATERRRMLAEHGQMARGYPDVRANTVAPSPVRARRLRVDAGLRGRRLHRIVDLMRHLRASGRPRHVRERCRSTPGAGGRRPSWSPTCPDSAARAAARSDCSTSSSSTGFPSGPESGTRQLGYSSIGARLVLRRRSPDRVGERDHRSRDGVSVR